MDTMTQNIHESTFISKSSVIIGNVIIKKNCGVFPNAVIRGDQNTITSCNQSASSVGVPATGT